MSRRLGGRFVLGRKIGSGGMSTVYLGTDEVLDRPVAIKVLKSEYVGSDIGARFRREGRTAARLSHPNIVQVYDAGEDEADGEKLSYIIMEHVPGGDLKELVKEKGPLPQKALSRIGADIAAGLAHAHDRGIIHRDIKPQNVLLNEYGQPKLTDFGIARALDSTQATQTGVYLGTALYSSPEQLQGKEITPKSDVYSLGITLYEAAAGAPPFTGTPIEVISQQLNGVLEAPRARGATIGAGFEEHILGCLQKDPDCRPGASGLREHLLQSGAATTGTAGAAGAAGVGGMIAVGAAGAAGSAGAARAAQALGNVREAGVEAFRKNFRPSPRVSGSRTPAGNVTFPTRTFGAGRNRMVLLAVAAVVLALLLVVLGLVLSRGSDTGAGPADRPADRPVAAGVTTGPTGATETSAGRRAAVPPVPRTTAPEEATTRRNTGEGQPTEVAAATRVAEMYLALGRQDYETSYSYLSRDYRRSEYPTLDDWARDYAGFEAMRFTDVPTARASNGEATVEGDMLVSADGSEAAGSGTWTLIEKGGEWKVSGIQADVQPQDYSGENGGDGEEGGDD